MPSTDFETEKHRFREYYADNFESWLATQASLKALLTLLLTDHQELETPAVESRIKDREECIKKFVRKYQKQLEEAGEAYEIRDHITDLLGFRVICLYETEIEQVRAILSENFQIIDVTDKTGLAEEKADTFGYKGLHLDLLLNDLRSDLPEYRRFKDLRFEVQIRTIVQDAWSVLDQKIKYKKNVPRNLARRINRISALFELADQEFLNIRDETRKLEEAATAAPAAPTEVAAPQALRLTPFEFFGIANKCFPGYPFLAHAIDGFVDELNALTPPITASRLEQALQDADETLKKYKEYQSERFRNRLNPFTTVRHALYLADRENYRSLLRDLQRTTFDEWLASLEGGAPAAG